MDKTTVLLIALGFVCLVALAFFSIFRHKGKLHIKSKLVELKAEGENAPPLIKAPDQQPHKQGSSAQKISGGATEIGQVGTGANVFVAQPGSNIIVQTGDRAISTKADEQQATAELPSSTIDTVETKSSSQPIRIPVKDAFDNECDTPPPTTTWVGRSEELLLMDNSETKVIAITGIGGQGKSTLAAKFLANTKNKAHFQDWRDCKEQGNTLHTQIVRIIERITNGERRASEISGESTVSVIKLFFNITATIEGVFVFDNIDQYVDVVRGQAVDAMHSLIEGALKSRGVAKFVFTCRPKLVYDYPGFLQIQLHGLSAEEARQLFRVRGVNVDVKHIDEVYELTQGHPLWLNLIATQILTNRVEIREFIARIKSGKDAGLPNVTLQEIWRTLKPKHQKLLRYFAETVHPETESHLEQYVSGELNSNQFTKCLRQLRALDLVVVKSPASGPDTIELHPLVREFVRRQFTQSERSPYISAIVVHLDRHILQFRAALGAEVSYSVLQNWTSKAELLINGGDCLKALSVLDEAKRPLLRNGYSEEFVRLSASLFGRLDWNEALVNDSSTYDSVYEDFIDALVQLGRFVEAEQQIKRFESTVSGATARHVAVCNMRTYLFWMEGKYDLAKEWGRRGVEFKASSQLDTGHDCSHNLALARRDSGEVNEALSYFLHGASLDEVVDRQKIVTNRGGSYYGNIGRCLVFKGDFDNALICLIKSAVLLEKARDELVLMNQGWAALWLGELFEKRQDSRMAFICYKRASNKWKAVSPPRSEQAGEAAQRMAEKDVNLLKLEDWAVERAYTDSLKKFNTFVLVA